VCGLCSTFMARKFAWSVKRVQWSHNIVKEFHKAATRIQQLVKHRRRRRQMVATRLQAIWRGWHYRSRIIMAKRDAQRRIALVWTGVARRWPL
jgi:hypothetical protein